MSYQKNFIKRAMHSLLKFLPIVGILLLTQLQCYTAQATTNELEGKKILVVMSYHPSSTWHQETKEGIDSQLKGATLKYFYLDSKNDLDSASSKAEEAFKLYNDFKPDAVIAAEDNAQSLFVIPFLKGKVTTPVVFCGVNDDATKFGYPASNVTGILEKKHYREGISLLQLIVPNAKKIAVIYRETPSNQSNVFQLKSERSTYKADITTFLNVNSVNDAEIGLAGLYENNDALIVLNLTGITDKKGKALSDKEAIAYINEIWSKPTIGVSSWEIEAGLLCAVAKKGQEQGETAGRMVNELISGKPITSVPITQNKNGQRIINVSTARRLKIQLKPIALINSELVK